MSIILLIFFLITFFDISFTSFLFKFFSLSPKSFLWNVEVASRLACANLEVKFSAVNLLNSWVVTYFAYSWSVVILSSTSLVLVL